MPWRITAHYPFGRSQKISPDPDRNGNYVYNSGRENAIGSTPRYLSVESSEDADWRPLKVDAAANFSLRLNELTDLKQVKTRIVYFINCYVNQNFIYLFTAQMRDLQRTGLLDQTSCQLFIVSSGSPEAKYAIAAELRKIFGSRPEIRHEHNGENQFEYPGIRKVWELGLLPEESFILYFHGRGISHLKLGPHRRNRQRAEQRLFSLVVAQWRQNLRWLLQIPSADKLGLSSGGNGWVWYNFWWARSSYIRHLEKPIVTDRRHYYEDWLGRYVSAARSDDGYEDTLGKCINLASKTVFHKYNIGSDFQPTNGEIHLGLPFGSVKYVFKRMIREIRVLLGR